MFRSVGWLPFHVNSLSSLCIVFPAYPDQHGIAPVPLSWGAPTAAVRGPAICSRLPSTIKSRNAIGAHSGSYSIYRALSIAMGTLNPSHKPDYSHTQPPFDIPPNPAWADPSQIVSLDPWGHLIPSVFAKEIEAGLDVRPSIAVTKAHLKMSELDDAARRGDLEVDGSIVMRSRPLKNEDGSPSDAEPGVEVSTSKAAVEPVWYLPGVADRFGMCVYPLPSPARLLTTGASVQRCCCVGRCSRRQVACILNSSHDLTSRYSCRPSAALRCISVSVTHLASPQVADTSAYSWKPGVYARREQGAYVTCTR